MFQKCAILLASVLLVLSLSAQTPDIDPRVALEQELFRVGAMDTSGLPPQLANILQGYYRTGFTSEENWESVQSMRFEGRLELASGQELSFFAYSKKPNLSKVVVMRPRSDARMTMAYDGIKAWQSFPGADGVETVQQMSEEEGSNFIRDSWFGGLLLYPNLPGKTIEPSPIRREDGVALIDIKVSAPDERAVTYTLQVNGFLDIAQKRENAVNGETEIIEQSDFRMISGIRVPFHSKLFSDGEWVHSLYLKEVRVNPGIPSWIFERP